MTYIVRVWELTDEIKCEDEDEARAEADRINRIGGLGRRADWFEE